MNGIAIDLSGRTAVVSGSGRGIGRSIAMAMARAGVAVFSRTEEEFHDIAAEIKSFEVDFGGG